MEDCRFLLKSCLLKDIGNIVNRYTVVVKKDSCDYTPSGLEMILLTSKQNIQVWTL